jgi:hypothetical protein
VKARIAIQCHSGSEVGDFLFTGPDVLENIKKPEARVSPVFPDLSGLFEWIETNGWKSDSQLREFERVEGGSK